MNPYHILIVVLFHSDRSYFYPWLKLASDDRYKSNILYSSVNLIGIVIFNYNFYFNNLLYTVIVIHKIDIFFKRKFDSLHT